MEKKENKTAWKPVCITEEGICGTCGNLDRSTVFLTCPPKFACTKSGKYHFESDKCDIFPEDDGAENKSDPAVAIGSNIEFWLNMRNMTQRELAEKAGSTAATISRYINGSRVPSAPKLYQIARALGCSANDLMQGVMDGTE